MPRVTNRGKIELEIREKLLKELAKVNPYYSDGSYKSPILVITEAMAIVRKG
jgi:hypothetical protein